MQRLTPRRSESKSTSHRHRRRAPTLARRTDETSSPRRSPTTEKRGRPGPQGRNHIAFNDG
ncbi:hypothetical protein EHG92_25920 [Salmonella enterica]|nr:hypothetical protein [Salmonella enterica]